MISRKVLLLIPVVLFLCLGSAFAGPDPKLVMDLTANPTSYVGTCPAVITFNGKISLQTKPGTVPPKFAKPLEIKYIFLRSDGATDTIVKTVTFAAPGVKDVSTTWTLGDATLFPAYNGWEAIKIVSPPQYAGMVSDKAPFKVKCQDKKPYQKLHDAMPAKQKKVQP